MFELSNSQNEYLLPSNLLSEPQSSDCDRLKLLLEAFGQNPMILRHVRSAVFRTFGHADKSLINTFIAYLSDAPGLTDLELTHCSRGDINHFAHLINNDKGRFSRLQYLRYAPEHESGSLPADGFDGICMLLSSSLRVVKMNCSVVERYFTKPTKERHAWSGTTKLNEIVISGFRCDEAALELVLPRSPRLKVLTLPPPGYGFLEDMGRLDGGPRRTVPRSGHADGTAFSPARIASLVSPVSNTLEDVSMYNDRIVVQIHDGSRLDLSVFSSLKCVEVSSHFYFGNYPSVAEAAADAYNDGFWKLLPYSVEEIHIQFDGLQGIFHSLEHLEQSFSAVEVSWERYDRLWAKGPGDAIAVAKTLSFIHEIITRKQHHFPSLRLVRLVESHNTKLLGWTKLERGLWHWVNVLSYYPELFESGGVHVNILIYEPDEYPGPPDERNDEWQAEPETTVQDSSI